MGEDGRGAASQAGLPAALPAEESGMMGKRVTLTLAFMFAALAGFLLFF